METTLQSVPLGVFFHNSYYHHRGDQYWITGGMMKCFNTRVQHGNHETNSVIPKSLCPNPNKRRNYFFVFNLTGTTLPNLSLKDHFLTTCRLPLQMMRQRKIQQQQKKLSGDTATHKAPPPPKKKTLKKTLRAERRCSGN